jgi:RHS repeat-associated protein
MKLARILILVVGSLISLLSSDALAGVCIGNGGTMTCVAPIPKTEWEYQACDDGPSNINKLKAWCTVRSGAWDTSIPGCTQMAALSGDNYIGLGGSWANEYHAACLPGAPVSGTGCSNYYCNCNDQYVNGVPSRLATVSTISGSSRDGLNNCASPWTEVVVSSMTRIVGCPDGYGQTPADASGNIECFKWPSSNNCVGNPVDCGNGEKRQREEDYASGDVGGLSFTRYYNSAGYWSLSSREAVNPDVWRHSYSSAVHAFPTGSSALAAVVRPQGDVRYFNSGGVEMQNFDGGAYRLLKLVDGGGAHTGWKLTTPQSDVEIYDTQGRLTSVTTRGGAVTTLAYDGSGRLQTAADPFGKTITLTYNVDGLLSTMTDPASRTYQYGYDSKKRLSTVTYPNSTTRTYLYEDTNRKWGLTGIVDERNSRLSTYSYDSIGRAASTERAGSEQRYTLVWTDYTTQLQASVVDAFNTSHTYWFNKVNGTLKATQHTAFGIGSENRTYDSNGNPATVTDRRGMVTTYVYDSTRNLETSRTEAYGTALARTITTTWHATYRLPATITEPSGVAGVSLVTEFTHDVAGNVTKKKMTAGSKVREWNYTYNGRGQVLTADGPRTDVTDVTTFVYYADNDSCAGCRGQVYAVTNAAGHLMTFNAYSADGRPTQITDANGVVTTLSYKPRGWLESRTVGAETTTYDYDNVGNLTKVTLPDSSWMSYTYDAANGLIAVEDNLGNSIEYELDVFGNRVQEVVYDPQSTLRKSLQRLYDGNNRLEKDMGALGQTVRYGRDNNGNVTSLTDPLSRVTTNTYDLLNRLTNVNDPANGNTVFTYDAKDRLLTVKDPKITATTTYTYDGLGNLLTQVSPDTGTTTFTHDNAGNVVTQTDGRSVTTTYTYDVLNRVIAATVTDGTVTYEYDNTSTGGAYAKGRLTKVTDPSGNTTYVYDSLGRATSKAQSVAATPSNKAFTVGYSYSGGRQTGMTYPSGRVVTYGFNAAGQVISISVDGTSVLASSEYFPFGPVKKWTWGNGQAMERTFDYDGRIASLTLGPSTATYPDLSQVFGYDSLNRLVSTNLAAGQTQGFTYDANGNRLTATINAATTTYTYPSTSHRLSSLSGATTRSFTYDGAGNTTVTAGITYAYDGRGRMKQAGATTYLVNGLGQRLKKSTASVDTYFAYDEAGRLIGEYDTSGTPIQETLWLGDLPVAVVKPATPSGFTVFHIWADHLGTPRHITDSANQSRWEWPHNDPFGNNAPNENPAGAGSFTYNLRFPGQYYDAETAKHYNYFRDYDPSLGRYIESDPVGLKAGTNTYGYVEATPLVAFDFLGLATFQCRRPLKGRAGADQRNGPDVPGNFSYHQYSCVDSYPKGLGFTCGGQGPASDSLGNFFYGKGKGADPGRDFFHPSACTKTQDDNECFETCLKRQWKRDRPNYGWPFAGRDCKEYDEDVNSTCRKECGIK